MARLGFCEALEEAITRASRPQPLELNESQRRAVDLLDSMLRGSASLPLGAVQGPPGTGKTSVVEELARRGVSRLLGGGEWELVIYAAPTNYLALQAFSRVSAALLAGGFSVRDVLDSVRVYGSKIALGDCKRLVKAHGLSMESLRRAVGGYIDGPEVRIVFTTEFQRVTGRITARTGPKRLHLIVDEASKTPFFRPFIVLADNILRSRGYPASLAALGDPEQAIAVPEAYRAGARLLIREVESILSHAGARGNYVFLDTTYRLPKPSEEPISEGFYNGMLRAYYTSTRRLMELRQVFEDYYRRVDAALKRLAGDAETRLIHEAIHEAVTTDKPVVVIDTGRPFRPHGLPTYDPRRALLAAKAALVLQAYASLDGGSPGVTVTSPYNDIAINIPFIFRVKGWTSSGVRPPASATVHSVIGGEDDAIIAVLGKEYTSSHGSTDYLDTIYFNEPPVLNVQLSRHQRLLIVVGHPGKLEETARRLRRFRDSNKLARTMERLRGLVEEDKAVRVTPGG